MGIIGINIRPATTTVALADLDARSARGPGVTSDRPNPQRSSLRELVPRIANLIKMRPEIASLEGIGVSLPGRGILASQRLVFAPNLGWG